MNLVTERLILREFRQQDWPTILAYQADPLYLRYYEWREQQQGPLQPRQWAQGHAGEAHR